MSKIAIITDTHFGARNDTLVFSQYFEKFYNDIFFPYLKDNNINTVVHMGDVFDRRKFINYKSLFDAKRYFFKPLADNNIKTYMLAGNHDTFYKTTNEVNSVSLLLKEFENITTFDEPCDNLYIESNGYSEPVVLMPWICKENYERAVNIIKNTNNSILFGHLEVKGFEMIRGQFCTDGLDTGLFNKFDMVFSGHFHHKSDNGTVYYTGNPYQTNWMDYKDPRGFHIFDLKNRNLEFIENPYEMFHKYVYNDENIEATQVQEMDFSMYQDCYVKVIVEQKNNPYVFDLILEKMYANGVADLNVVETFADVEDDIEIDQAQDTITILSGYIDNMEDNVDKKNLDLLMRRLYNEALTSE